MTIMARRRISSGSPYEEKAAYSRVVVDGPWCFVAGTTGFDSDTGAYPDAAADQARNAIVTITAALAEAEFSLPDVVRARYYVVNRDDVPAIMAVLSEAFAETRPAATMVICELIEPAMKVEIEVTALRLDSE